MSTSLPTSFVPVDLFNQLKRTFKSFNELTAENMDVEQELAEMESMLKEATKVSVTSRGLWAEEMEARHALRTFVTQKGLVEKFPYLAAEVDPGDAYVWELRLETSPQFPAPVPPANHGSASPALSSESLSKISTVTPGEGQASTSKKGTSTPGRVETARISTNTTVEAKSGGIPGRSSGMVSAPRTELSVVIPRLMFPKPKPVIHGTPKIPPQASKPPTRTSSRNKSMEIGQGALDESTDLATSTGSKKRKRDEEVEGDEEELVEEMVLDSINVKEKRKRTRIITLQGKSNFSTGLDTVRGSSVTNRPARSSVRVDMSGFQVPPELFAMDLDFLREGSVVRLRTKPVVPTREMSLADIEQEMARNNYRIEHLREESQRSIAAYLEMAARISVQLENLNWFEGRNKLLKKRISEYWDGANVDTDAGDEETYNGDQFQEDMGEE